MLRVFGLTFENTSNYGSCLQTYALSAAIEQQTVGGAPCAYSLIPISSFPDGPRRSRFGSGGAFALFFRVYRSFFTAFEKRHLHFADCRSLAELDRLNEKTDAFVCGSDVIWNPDFNNGISAFYLDFAKKYKFSYAASFGRSVGLDELQPFLPYFSELREIGLRESDGLRIVRQITDRPAQVVADPVLLLTADDWNRVAGPGGKKGGYIFVYLTHPTAVLSGIREKLQKQTGLPVKLMIWDKSVRSCLKKGRLFAAPPERFLRLLRDADYVVTNSFHATAFSLLFHKRFFTAVQGERTGGVNLRMADLLSRVGFMDRLLNEVPGSLDLSNPDFSASDAEIARMRAESLAFLQRNLEAAYQEKLNREKGDRTDG